MRAPEVITVKATAVEVADGMGGDELTADERKELKQCEARINKGFSKSLEGFLEAGHALRNIRDRRLYRKTHKTLEAYMEDRYGLKKSSGYDLIDGAAAYLLAQPVATSMKIRFTTPAQLRPLVGLETTANVKAVLHRKLREMKLDGDGYKIPTMRLLERARHEEWSSPDDLKREAAEKKAREAQAAGTTKLMHLISGAPATPLQEPTAEVPSGAPNDADGLPPEELGSGRSFDPTALRHEAWGSARSRIGLRAH